MILGAMGRRSSAGATSRWYSVGAVGRWSSVGATGRWISAGAMGRWTSVGAKGWWSRVGAKGRWSSVAAMGWWSSIGAKGRWSSVSTNGKWTWADGPQLLLLARDLQSVLRAVFTWCNGQMVLSWCYGQMTLSWLLAMAHKWLYGPSTQLTDQLPPKTSQLLMLNRCCLQRNHS